MNEDAQNPREVLGELLHGLVEEWLMSDEGQSARTEHGLSVVFGTVCSVVPVDSTGCIGGQITLEQAAYVIMNPSDGPARANASESIKTFVQQITIEPSMVETREWPGLVVP